MVTLEIRVQDGAILCGRTGGHVRGETGHRIQWTSDRDFTLEFFRLAEEPEEGCAADPEGLGGWPFSEPARPQDVKWPLKQFAGVLNDGYGAYKYYITVGNLRLDPIIIIDRMR